MADRDFGWFVIGEADGQLSVVGRYETQEQAEDEPGEGFRRLYIAEVTQVVG